MTSHALPEPAPVWDSSFASAERFLAPSPVWDASLQRRKLLEHAVDVSARVQHGIVGLIAEPLVAAAEHGTVQSVRLQPLADGVARVARIDTDRTRVELGGTEVAVRHEPMSGGGVRLLVPEVDAPTPLRVVAAVGEETVVLETVLLRPRHYEVHLVHHSHLDIGYTDRQHVVRAQHLSYLDDVLRLARETDDLSEDARFRWNEEALFSVTEWFANRPARAHAELLRRVEENRVSLSAMPFNLHTEICSTDELHELLRPALELKRRHGVQFRTAMQTDVPGHVIGLPDALGQLGVQFLSVAHNWAGRSDPDGHGQMALPRMFRWRGPEGGEVVVWRTDTPHGLAYMEGPMVGLHESYDVTSEVFGAYLASLGTRPYPMPVGSIFGWLDGGADVNERPPYAWDVLHLRTHGRWSDNAGPSRAVSDIVEEWNRRWLFPRLRVSTNEAFFDAATARFGDELPTVTGDWNDWWAHGVGSAVAPVGLGRQAQNDLADAQTLGAVARLLDDDVTAPVVDPHEGYRQLALWDEHTWGASNSWEHEDHGSSSGEHQWYWKVARAYAAVDESDHALQLASAALAGHLGRHPDALVSVYAFSTTGAPRTDELEVFVPAGVVALAQAVTLVDARDGSVLPHTERPEPAGSRGLGRYLRCRLVDVPPVGFVRVDVRAAEEHPAAAEMLSDPTRLENEHLVARLDLSRGTVASLVEKATGRELVDAGSSFGFNHYVYDRYATVGRSNHNSSKFADSGNMALISSREVGGPAAVVSATRDARGEQVVLRSQVGGARSLQVTYRLPAGVAHLEITNRLSKDSTWDKESAFFAFPFATSGDPTALEESAGGLTGPGLTQVPGSAEYMRAIRHFVSLQDGAAAAAWATAEVPLVELGTLSLPYVPFGSTLRAEEPGTVFSWVHNNIWDTNFPVQQAFDTDLRYRVAAGTGDAPALASRTAATLVQPLRPVLAERADAAAPTSGSLLGLSDERVQVIGLQHGEDGSVLVRLRSNAPNGLVTTVRLPEGATRVRAATFLGEPLADLPVVDGGVEVTFTGSGVRAVLLG